MHALVLAVLLAGCAASRGARAVYLEADYPCGAVEGLGCGLAIQPVLERIDGLPGVSRSATSWDGGTFRIEVEPGADPDRVAEAAAGVLALDADHVARARAEDAAADQWYDAFGTRALSRHEASVIAASFRDAIAREVGLEPDAAERLHAVLLAELERAFERAHEAGGGVHRLYEEIPEGWQRLQARIPSILPPGKQVEVSAVLERELGR